jgi:hypothetical protein
MLATDLAPWQGKIAVLTFADGESATAHVLYVDPRQNEIIVDVLASSRPYEDSDHRAFTICTRKIRSVLPAPAGLYARRALPPPDPCRTGAVFSLARIVLFTLLFLIFISGGIIEVVLADRPYGIQFGSMLVYTAAVVFYTFGSGQGRQRYLFGCPIVRPQLSRLAWRHVGFLALLFVFLTVAFQFRSRLPAAWLLSRGEHLPLFVTGLFVVGVILAVVETVTNRSLLKRAHLEYASE